MALSKEQQQQLLQKTKSNTPNWEISGWLMKECGLTFQEASKERGQAIKQIENETNIEKGQTEVEQNVQKEGSEASEETMESPSEEADDEEEFNFDEEEINAEEKTNRGEIPEVCITRGSEDFSCSCPIKKVEDTPF